MILNEIINSRLDRLNESYKDLGVLKREYNLLNEFLNSVSKDLKAIIDFDLDSIFAIILQYIEYDDAMKNGKSLKEEINNSKIILRGIIRENLRISLTDSQKDSIYDLINKVRLSLDSLSSKMSLIRIIEDEIIELEVLLEKIDNPDNKEALNQDDFQVIYKIIEDPIVSIETKKSIMLEFIRFNNDLLVQKVPFDIESMKDLFKSYGFSEDMMSIIEKFKGEISKHGNLLKMSEILEYLDYENREEGKINILKRFENYALVSIVLYGSIDSVKHRYKQAHSDGELKTGSIYYEEPSFWVANARKKKEDDIARKKSVIEYLYGRTLYDIAHRTSYEDASLNVEFLQNVGFDEAEINADGYRVVMRTPHYVIRENYEKCRMYRLVSERSQNKSGYKFVLNNIMDRCDSFIEVGLHSYISNYSSAIQNSKPELIPVLNLIKHERTPIEFRELVYSKTHTGRLSMDLTKNLLGYNTRNIDELLKEAFIDQSNPKVIPNYEVYSDLITEDTSLIDPSVFDSQVVKVLDFGYKKSEYEYEIDSQIISRKKVLRILSRLNMEEGLTGNDKEIFALTYGSYMTEEVFNKISEIISYKREEVKDGLLERI